MSNLPILINTILGLVIFVSMILAVLNYEDDLDVVDRVIIAGFAGSMLMTTPALWLSNTPFEWSFNLSRSFLAAYAVKRFLVPVIWKWRYHRRHQDQMAQSARRMVDRLRHKL
jgi:hypothetical protein